MYLDKLGLIVDPFFMNKIILFFKEVQEELSKVVWPSRDQAIRYTILVVIVAVAVGLILGGLDSLLTLLTDFLVNK